MHTGSRYAQLEFFTGLHQRGCAGAATVTLQPAAKKANKKAPSVDADEPAEEPGDAEAEKSRKVGALV